MTETETKPADEGSGDDKVVAWKTWVVTSVAAILTGFAAYYFICAETWGGTFMDMLSRHTLSMEEVDGAIRWVALRIGTMAIVKHLGEFLLRTAGERTVSRVKRALFCALLEQHFHGRAHDLLRGQVRRFWFGLL